MGEVEAVETDAKGNGRGKYLRVWIKFDLIKPLAHGRVIKLQGKKKWITFQYESFPRFCFQCDLIRHGSAGCPNRSINSLMEAGNEFGPWLRMPPPRKCIMNSWNRLSTWSGNGKEGVAGKPIYGQPNFGRRWQSNNHLAGGDLGGTRPGFLESM